MSAESQRGEMPHTTLALVGNPNCGKTTLFNGLTGENQHIGNWPGVTVETKEGEFTLPSGRIATLMDLPGIYSLTATSGDETASLNYILSHTADLYINVLDATALTRNLYLTLLLCELKVPMIVVVTMVDLARKRGLAVDLEHLSAHLGVPVIGLNATDATDVKHFLGTLESALTTTCEPHVPLAYPNELEQEIDVLSSCTIKTAAALQVSPRWVAIKALEGDPFIAQKLVAYHDMAPEVIRGAIARCVEVLKAEPDIVLAEARYGLISGLVKDVVSGLPNTIDVSERIDCVALNRILGIPIFLVIMGAVFGVTQLVGAPLAEVFSDFGDMVFVRGSAYLLNLLHAPDWLIAVVAHGGGMALQTVLAFIPPVGLMFLALALLEDSGYMARAAFLMDRFMRWLGLPGKSFVPMLVGFGCTVPAIMATRTLESRRDRLLNVFMIPFMSCGAKLPIWVLFGAAFFPQNPGGFVALMYFTGIALGILTGLGLKYTLFQGEPSHFIMELPPYHCPRPRHILLHTWERLRTFVVRAGKFIVPMVLVLGLLNAVGTDGKIGQTESGNSALAVVGKRLTPVFEPIGVTHENWPATVAIFSGLFAKESVIGTLQGLYGSIDATSETAAENTAAKDALLRHFPQGFHQAFAYLLFILLYMPCLAATGVVFNEIGKGYGVVFVTYLTVLGWSVATLYHAVMVSGSVFWGVVATGLLSAMFTGFWVYGRRYKTDFA